MKDYGEFVRVWLGPELNVVISDPKDVEVNKQKHVLCGFDNFDHICTTADVFSWCIFKSVFFIRSFNVKKLLFGSFKFEFRTIFA